MQLTQALLDRLVCPVCHAGLLLSPTSIDCIGCHRRYPIDDGIAVLIADRATLPESPA